MARTYGDVAGERLRGRAGGVRAPLVKKFLKCAFVYFFYHQRTFVCFTRGFCLRTNQPKIFTLKIFKKVVKYSNTAITFNINMLWKFNSVKIDNFILILQHNKTSFRKIYSAVSGPT
jgi:hypothetical protein